ncbi:MAG: Asp-tRNA(Asn)/Glu-tRNA(Gln) amidotransferase subunit GatB [Coriobacteriales bacterium]|jgi:aspartyl-tRNA(Asn)/glutamyl-tRNA(Gln) amidotransferase subunit B|nr:Asp-tRNA(Asn)/Glu-tRNA(Gln) amidotransferase subunit GatB [Coriobacteriales bacterium]
MKELKAVLANWEAVIGLEVHTELTTLQTKMFCSCKIEYGAAPNTHVCPVCLGMPGALPQPNKAAIQSIVLAGLATNCQIQRRSMFYRKNYFYPDMSKNFQTTQGPVAFCMYGGIDLEVTGAAACERDQRQGTRPLASGDGYVTPIGIQRIHMEEDAGKMVHVGGESGRITGADYSLLDYNRCGTPLIELVTKPDLRTPEEARLFLQELRQIFLALRISDCSMEQGSLRCDGNISLRRRGSEQLGAKTELKNMNSFKNLHDGLAYEICRQAKVLESGERVLQETRHWEPSARRTVSMRIKETADDYRLFPEPDLAPYDLSDEFVASVRAMLPELPAARRTRYLSDYELPAADARLLAADNDLAAFFDSALLAASANTDGDLSASGLGGGKGGQAKSVRLVTLAKQLANLLLNDTQAYLNVHNFKLVDTSLTPEHLVQLAALVADGELSSKQGKEVFAQTIKEGTSPRDTVNHLGIKQLSDTDALQAVVNDVLARFPDKVQQYRAGKTGLLGFFVGQAMQATTGQANPQLLNEMFMQTLAE